MTDDAVLKMVEQELKKRPDMKSAELLEKVAKKHASVRDLTTRQFHARYPLRVKRAMAAGKSRAASGRKASKAAKPKTRRTSSTRTRKGTKPKTRRATKKRGRRRAAPAPSRRPEATRDVLLEFAQELLDMGADPTFKSVLDRVDSYTQRLAG